MSNTPIDGLQAGLLRPVKSLKPRVRRSSIQSVLPDLPDLRLHKITTRVENSDANLPHAFEFFDDACACAPSPKQATR